MAEPTPLNQSFTIQQQSIASEGESLPTSDQQLLIDEVVLSPLQKYRKYGRFPWELLLTAVMILSATFSSQATVLIQYPQQREIQTFFNFHLLAHDSWDIYEGSYVFTWSTHQYRTLDEMMEFFNRTLQVMLGLNNLNFYPLNETHHLLTNHTVKRVFRNGSTTVEQLTLPQLAESGDLTVRLKESSSNVRMLQVRFRLCNISSNVEQVDIILDVEFRQKFMMFVEVDTEFVQTNFSTDRRLFDGSDNSSSQNLKIRKLPNEHHNSLDPPRVGYIAAVLLIGLTVRSILRRYSGYKKHPIAIEGVANGQEFSSMNLRQKITLLGVWNFLMVGLCLGSFLGGGISAFLCWLQIARYLEYTSNPYLISFLMRKVVVVEAILLLNVLIVLTGFVMFSMVVFTATKKFENVRQAFFVYIFNNFQYGIYENFIALEQYGGFAQFLYYLLLFYMVSCANQMLPSILCGLVISRGRYEDLQDFMRKLKMPCPVCNSITNNSPRRRGNQVASSEVEESKVLLEVASPTLSPFLTPTTEPMRAAKKQAMGALLKKRTMFQIRQEAAPTKPVTTKAQAFRLFRQKSELLMMQFEECMMVLELNKEPRHKQMLVKQLEGSLARLERLREGPSPPPKLVLPQQPSH